MAQVFFIKKKSGGVRLIYKPSKEEKERNLEAFFDLFPKKIVYSEEPPFFPYFITGFSPYSSNVLNAALHQRTLSQTQGDIDFNCSLLIDIKDFFPSISLDILYRGLQSFSDLWVYPEVGYHVNFDKDSLLDFTLFGSLPQGFPASPFLANIAFFPADIEIHGALVSYFHKANKRFRYTRYADDITVSWIGALPKARNTMMDISKIIWNIVEKYGFEVNDNKTRFINNFGGKRRIITGVAVDKWGIYAPRYLQRRLRAMKHNGADEKRIKGLANYIGYIDKISQKLERREISIKNSRVIFK